MSEKIYQIALSLINSVGPITAKTMVSHCGSPEAVFRASRGKLMKIPGVGPKTVNEILDPRVLEKAERELTFALNNGIQCYFYLDQDYPFRLKPFNDSPVVLYYKGEDVLNNPRMVGVIGTRKPSDKGILFCEQIVAQLKDYEVTVVSGLAYGVDAVAHRKSVELDIPTLGVMGNGMAITYPATHRGLRQKMMRNGGVLTEFSYITKPEREHFPMRNRIIAAMADALLVIESGRKGGSMITAHFAFDYNKDVFALPGRPDDSLAAGPNFLIKSNVASLAETAEDIAYKMLWEKEKLSTNGQLKLFQDLSEEESMIVEIIRNAPDKNPSTDYVLYESKMNLSRLSGLILQLELKNVLKTWPGSRLTLIG
jgi:DNA processing protein